MFQTLVIIASIVVLSAAILTSTIVSAKNAFHQVVVAKTQTAMNDATSQFQFWAQKFAAQYGTEADWAAQSAQQAPIFRPMCGNAVTACNFYETLQWKVTGATSGVPVQGSAGQTVSTAANMTQAIDEQRISATITAVVSDARGIQLHGGRTEEVTARVLNVAPYITITATHELASAGGTAASSEGDTGGVVDPNPGRDSTLPDAAKPYKFTDTTIRATIDCANTPLFDELHPEAVPDNGASLFNAQYHSGGDLVWAYEAPCTPTYGVPSAPPMLQHYEAPQGSVYQIDAADLSTHWNKGDANSEGFPR